MLVVIAFTSIDKEEEYSCYSFNFNDHRELDREKRQARLALWPLLLAESDLAYLNKLEENQALEAEVMKDVPGWLSEPKIYRTDRYQRPVLYLSDFLVS